MRHVLVALVLAALATTARAAPKQSDRWGSFEFSAGTYRPNIDAEFVGSTPYADAFGTGRDWVFRGGFSRSLFTRYGALDLGVEAGYFKASGHGRNADGTPNADETTFKIIPTALTLTYRLDVLAERYNIPFAPYARAALERYNWWTTDGNGDTVKSGATNGWSIAGGLALLLDVFNPDLARELDRDQGVNHSYIFVEARKTKVDDFGSSSSWDLSDEKIQLSGGLLFVF